jgi:adenosylcobinamide-phosphate synthase
MIAFLTAFFASPLSSTAWVLPAGVLLDLLLGEPHRMHPVIAIGNLTAWLETITRRWIPIALIAGIVASLSLLTIVLGITLALGFAAAALHPVALYVLAGAGIWITIAAKSMVEHSELVLAALGRGDLTDAREKTGWIVGRETSELNEDEIIRATVESVSESAVDGVTGPLLYAGLGAGVAGLFAPAWLHPALGALLGAFCFRAINTLDSMYGYRNERYLYFGRFAARLDDVAGYLPARITPFVIALAALLTGENAPRALRIWWRDGGQHLSPNAGQCEAAFAGALGIQLGGTNVYHGVAVPKPTIGDELATRAPEHVRRANRLLITTTVLFALLCASGLILLDFLGRS